MNKITFIYLFCHMEQLYVYSVLDLSPASTVRRVSSEKQVSFYNKSKWIVSEVRGMLGDIFLQSFQVDEDNNNLHNLREVNWKIVGKIWNSQKLRKRWGNSSYAMNLIKKKIIHTTSIWIYGAHSNQKAYTGWIYYPAVPKRKEGTTWWAILSVGWK